MSRDVEFSHAFRKGAVQGATVGAALASGLLAWTARSMLETLTFSLLAVGGGALALVTARRQRRCGWV